MSINENATHRICFLQNIQSLDNLFAQMDAQLGFPEDMGHNLDALYDYLSGIAEGPLVIYWEDYKDSAHFLGNQLYNTLIDLFEQVEIERLDFTFITS